MRIASLALGVLLLSAAAASAATQKLSFAGDSVSTILAEGGEHALLKGHAWIQTEDLRITADQVELFGTDYIYARCSGSIHVVDAKRGLDLTSDELFYDRDQKVARIQGNATMADLKNEMVVKGGFIEDRDNEQITIIQIGVRIFKKDIECKAEYARYQRDKKILELSGMPWVSKGTDIYQASRITINLDTEDINLEGDVKGTIQTQTKEQAGQEGQTGQAQGGTASGEAQPQGTSQPQGSSQPPGTPAAPPAKAPLRGGARAQ